jgi:hypothetical protein
MTQRISIAGATGNLGMRMGANVAVVDSADASAVAKALEGSSCVASTLQGLRDVIVGAQSILLEAAISAGVGRFIPSDFSTDFTKLPAGGNRNFDLRREFHSRLDCAHIAATAIFNGAFGDFKNRIVGYWGDPDWRLDFTTMDDTAAYTAAVALDSKTPAALRIASFQVTPTELQRFTEESMKTPFTLKCLGGLDELAAHIARTRAAHPEGEAELFPAWQQSQYMHGMFSTQHESLDNSRYPELEWTSLEKLLSKRA